MMKMARADKNNKNRINKSKRLEREREMQHDSNDLVDDLYVKSWTPINQTLLLCLRKQHVQLWPFFFNYFEFTANSYLKKKKLAAN